MSTELPDEVVHAIAARAIRRDVTSPGWEVHAAPGPLGWAIPTPEVVALLDQLLTEGTIVVGDDGRAQVAPPSTRDLLDEVAARLDRYMIAENPAGPTLAAALHAVLNVHDNDADGHCTGCGVFIDGEPVKAPCATELAIREVLV